MQNNLRPGASVANRLGVLRPPVDIAEGFLIFMFLYLPQRRSFLRRMQKTKVHFLPAVSNSRTSVWSRRPTRLFAI